MNDCAHAAGHGYFYYFFDIGRSVLACTDPTLASHAPGPEFSWDADAKSAGLDGINYMSEPCLRHTRLSHGARIYIRPHSGTPTRMRSCSALAFSL